eukprot:Blabericola_migrator_1__3001@NODE_186_length_11793_cov_118_761556_g161_i0_p2_GENE_NODE_186_length_11793_cov_118_761556_g161_i0NODE_186_length_11793_cov_118_761556_g161_i0_p2_ORF_typecomplete_len810_score139_39_NODE_186_length_11793_cov_118_761556_g161_i056378066
MIEDQNSNLLNEGTPKPTPPCFLPPPALPKLTIEVTSSTDPWTGTLVLKPRVIALSEESPCQKEEAATPLEASSPPSLEDVHASMGEDWIMVDSDFRMDEGEARGFLDDFLVELLETEGGVDPAQEPSRGSINIALQLQQSVVRQYPSERSLLDFLLGRQIIKYQNLLPHSAHFIKCIGPDPVRSGVKSFMKASNEVSNAAGCKSLYFEDIVRFLLAQYNAASKPEPVRHTDVEQVGFRLTQRICWTILTARCVLAPESDSSHTHTAEAEARQLSTTTLCLLIETFTLLCLRTLRALTIAFHGPSPESEIIADENSHHSSKERMVFPSKAATSVTELWWSMAELIAEASGNGTLPLDGDPIAEDSLLTETTLFHWVCILNPNLYHYTKRLRVQLISDWLSLMEAIGSRRQSSLKQLSPDSASYKFVPMIQLLKNWHFVFDGMEPTEQNKRIKALILARAAKKLTLLWKSGLRPDDTPSIKCLIFDYPLIIKLCELALELAESDPGWIGQSTWVTESESAEDDEQHTRANSTEIALREPPPVDRVSSRAIVFVSVLLVRIFQSSILFFRRHLDCDPSVRVKLPKADDWITMAEKSIFLFALLQSAVPQWQDLFDIEAACLPNTLLLASLRCLRLLRSFIVHAWTKDEIVSRRSSSTDYTRPTTTQCPATPSSLVVTLRSTPWYILDSFAAASPDASDPARAEIYEEIMIWRRSQLLLQTPDLFSPAPSSQGYKNKLVPKKPLATNRWVRRRPIDPKCFKLKSRHEPKGPSLCILLGLAMASILIVLTVYRSKSISMLQAASQSSSRHVHL